MKQIQTELFKDMQKLKRKPEHTPLEKGFMLQVMDYASKIGLPNLHIDYYCGNKFYIECPCCGNKTLAECHKSNNQSNAGLPDVIGIAWGIECKRSGYEPSTQQQRVHAQLRQHNTPVITVSPDNVQDAERFLRGLQK